MIRYLRWRLSRLGREAYRTYAQGRAAIDEATREQAVRQTRMATAETGSDWPDGRWERTRWVNGQPARTYRGTRVPRSRTRLPGSLLARRTR